MRPTLRKINSKKVYNQELSINTCTKPSEVVMMPSGGDATRPSWSTATPGPQELSEQAGSGAASGDGMATISCGGKLEMFRHHKVFFNPGYWSTGRNLLYLQP